VTLGCCRACGVPVTWPGQCWVLLTLNWSACWKRWHSEPERSLPCLRACLVCPCCFWHEWQPCPRLALCLSVQVSSAKTLQSIWIARLTTLEFTVEPMSLWGEKAFLWTDSLPRLTCWRMGGSSRHFLLERCSQLQTSKSILQRCHPLSGGWNHSACVWNSCHSSVLKLQDQHCLVCRSHCFSSINSKCVRCRSRRQSVGDWVFDLNSVPFLRTSERFEWKYFSLMLSTVYFAAVYVLL